jgi:hypothetical protein
MRFCDNISLCATTTAPFTIFSKASTYLTGELSFKLLIFGACGVGEEALEWRGCGKRWWMFDSGFARAEGAVR